MPEQLASSRQYFQFSSTLFLLEQTEDQIDCWFPGADCAGWFYARLLPLPGVTYGAAPIMEDWGGQFEIKVDGTTLIVRVWSFDEWIFGVDLPRSGWFSKPDPGRDQARERLCDAIESIARSDERITVGGWHSEMP